MRRDPSVAPAIRSGMLMSGPTISLTARRSKGTDAGAGRHEDGNEHEPGLRCRHFQICRQQRAAIPVRYPKIVARLRKKPVMNPSTTATKRQR